MTTKGNLDCRSAFRRTFLYQMPGRDVRAFEAFGETIYEYGLEMTRYDSAGGAGLPHHRTTLLAALEDIEFLEGFLREALDSPEEAAPSDRRFAAGGEAARRKLREISSDIRALLRKRPRQEPEADA